MRGGSKGSCEKFGGRVELMSQCWWHEETVGLPIMSKGDVPTVTGRHCIVHNLRSSKCCGNTKPKQSVSGATRTVKGVAFRIWY
jgi:hypothetical protein